MVFELRFLRLRLASAECLLQGAQLREALLAALWAAPLAALVQTFCRGRSFMQRTQDVFKSKDDTSAVQKEKNILIKMISNFFPWCSRRTPGTRFPKVPHKRSALKGFQVPQGFQIKVLNKGIKVQIL